MNIRTDLPPQIRDFITELTAFAGTAESTLKKIEEDMETNKGMFAVFSQKMIAIRGTAQQLRLDEIAKIAGLGEEIALKGVLAERRQVRKCVGSLWDALTTVKYMLEHYHEETQEEQLILINRLESTLKSFGGARQTVAENEIEELLKKRG